MALIGRFIGANEYLDPDIRDLSGARRDAIALWALFSDTMPEMNAELIIGEDANLSKVKEAIEGTLKNATEDDIIVLFFSGHGSQNHRLAAHDTVLKDLDNTTYPMQTLSELFKSCKAKSILCILDCCFSGGAPAKVLEDTPVAKDMGNPIAALAGTGRMIIAASNFDEPSYELPSTGHGILTKALIDTLQSPDENINLLSAVQKIMDLVRSEASRIGVVQTPVLLNHIEGGLVLPSLKPGDKYYAAFPQKRGITVSKNLEDLQRFGFPVKLTDEWKTLFKDGLNELQLTAINEYRILDGEHLLVIAPTSSGKTFVGELASIQAILEGKKAVFLLPYRALVNEKYDQFVETYQNKLGYKIIRCTGDYQDNNEAFIKGKYDIALLTYEMFLNISVSVPSVLNNMGLVVLDEAQFITDPNRGISVELLLTRLLVARQRGISPQLVVLSAVIGDSNFFEDWLGSKKLITTERPVPLIEGVMDRNGIFKYRDTLGNVKEEEFLPPGSIYQRKDKPQAQDMIVPLVKKLVDAGEKVIVFRNRRGNAEGCAGYLSRELGLPPATEELSKLPKYTSSSTSEHLKASLSGGVAFHNSNLSRDERALVERAFRDPNGKVRVLAATTTVAAGLNTPASTVVLAEQEFVGEDGRQFTVAEYKNMAGRAGRVGFDNEKGKAIVLADEGFHPDVLFERYVLGSLGSLSSSFDPKNLETWIIRLLAQLPEVVKDELVSLLANTYGGYVANRQNPEWLKDIGIQIKELYDEMLKLGLVEEENGIVHLTLLGKACGESVFSFRSAMRLVDLLKSYQASSLTPEALMAIVQVLPESDDSYTPMFKRGTSEMARQREAASRYGNDVVRLLQKYAQGDQMVYYARCKRAAVLFDWVNGVQTETIETTYKSNHPYYGNIEYGDIRRFADFTRFQLRSAFKIASLIFPGQVIDEKAMDKLLKELEVGLPEKCLELLEIPIDMSREEYLALGNSGITNKELLLAASKEQLSAILEAGTVEQISKISS